MVYTAMCPDVPVWYHQQISNMTPSTIEPNVLKTQACSHFWMTSRRDITPWVHQLHHKDTGVQNLSARLWKALSSTFVHACTRSMHCCSGILNLNFLLREKRWRGLVSHSHTLTSQYHTCGHAWCAGNRSCQSRKPWLCKGTTRWANVTRWLTRWSTVSLC